MCDPNNGCEGDYCYTDDRQLYLSFRPNDTANQEAALTRVERCIEDIRNWMLNDKLKLNDENTEFMIISTVQPLAKVSSKIQLVVYHQCYVLIG